MIRKFNEYINEAVHYGQRVICIEGDPHRDYLEVGKTYEIEDIDVHDNYVLKGVKHSWSKNKFKKDDSYKEPPPYKGDEVYVKDNLADYISHYDWDDEVLPIIGKKLKVLKKDFNPYDKDPGFETNPCVLLKNKYGIDMSGFSVPVKCLAIGEEEIDKYKKGKMKLAKKMKDIDPYNEERWED